MEIIELNWHCIASMLYVHTYVNVNSRPQVMYWPRFTCGYEMKHIGKRTLLLLSIVDQTYILPSFSHSSASHRSDPTVCQDLALSPGLGARIAKIAARRDNLYRLLSAPGRPCALPCCYARSRTITNALSKNGKCSSGMQ